MMGPLRCLLGTVMSGVYQASVRQISSSSVSPVRLAYACYQSTNSVSDLPPLVIIHGLFGSKRNWDTLSKAISRQGIKVIAVDCRNHGESPHVPEMDYLSMAADIEALMGELDLLEAVILGHSMGGKAAMALALTKPKLVTKLLIEDIAPNYSREMVRSEYPGYIAAQKAVVFDNTMTMAEVRKDVGEQLQEVFPDPGLRAFILTNIVEGDDGYRWAVNLDAIGTHLQEIISFPRFDAQYTGDTMFIGGSRSEHISPGDFAEIRRLFPRAQIQHINDAGHWVHAEKPNEFKNSVMKFVERKS